MDFLSVLFPRRCMGCNEIGSYLCADCVNRAIPMQDLYCPVCRQPSRYGATHARCRTRFTIDGLISCYPYAGILKKAIVKFKYSFVSDLTQTLIELMITGAIHPQLFAHQWALVPVPLHTSREKWRGYNQAKLLADGLGNAWQWPVEKVLTRTRPTTAQMTLTGNKRRQNLVGAFTVTPRAVMPQRVILVDDVATTCSTLNECARVLKEARVKEVWGLTLAQQVPH